MKTLAGLRDLAADSWIAFIRFVATVGFMAATIGLAQVIVAGLAAATGGDFGPGK
jgi:hypothetical protein